MAVTAEPTAAVETPAGEETTLVAAISDLSAMDWTPSLASGDEEKILAMIGDNLTQLNPETRQLEGALAESWELSPDGKIWTWHLRPNIAFHDDWGNVTCEDVKFTWWEWAGPESTHSIGPQMSQAIDDNLDNFKCLDDLTFTLTTTKPIVHLPALVCSCNPGPTITSKKYFDEKGDEANKHPIGTGPWKFVSATPGVEIVMDKVPNHWNHTASFDHLVLKEIPDGAARLAQVNAGAVDIALLDAELSGEATAAGLRIMTIPDFGNAFVLLGGSYWLDEEHLDKDSPWIQADSPKKGLAIRQAMSLAIDRQLIIDRVLNGEATLAYGPIIQYPQPDLIDPSWTYPEYNLDAAKAKLAEGGYPDGFPVKMPLFADDINTDAIGEAIAGMWEELGLTVTREPTEKDAIDPLQENRTTDGLAYVLISGYVAEPAKTISNYVSFRPDDAKMFLQEIDDTYNAISVETDHDKRFKLARDLITVLRDTAQPIPLFTVNMPFVVGPRVGSWSPIPGINSINQLETITPP